DGRPDPAGAADSRMGLRGAGRARHRGAAGCGHSRLDLRCQPDAHPLRPPRRRSRRAAMAAMNQLRAYGRIGLLATTLLLGAALVLGAWSNYVASRAALDTLYRGQAELLEAALRSESPPWRPEPDSSALRAFVDS